MTIGLKEEIVDDKYIYIQMQKYSCAYEVGICPYFGNNRAGSPLDERLYDTFQKAKRRYNDLKKQAKKGVWG